MRVHCTTYCERASTRGVCGTALPGQRDSVKVMQRQRACIALLERIFPVPLITLNPVHTPQPIHTEKPLWNESFKTGRMALAQWKAVYFLALCSNHRKRFLPKSVRRNWWRQVATAPGLQTISLCCSSLDSISQALFSLRGCYLHWSSIFVTDAPRGEPEAWKILKDGLRRGSREAVWSVFCFSLVRCQQNVCLRGGEPFLLFPEVVSPL